MKHERGFVIHPIHAGTYMWEQANGRLYLVTTDGDLLLTSENYDPPPPPGYVAKAFADAA